MDALEQAVRELLTSRAVLQVSQTALQESQKAMQRALRQLATGVKAARVDVQRLTDTVGEIWGDYLEHRYREHAPGYFQSLLRRIRPLEASEVDDQASEAAEMERISEADREDVLRADLVLTGENRESRVRQYVMAEISAVIDSDDVRRAHQRAALWSRITGEPVQAAVAGERITEAARAVALESDVAMVLDGRITQ